MTTTPPPVQLDNMCLALGNQRRMVINLVQHLLDSCPKQLAEAEQLVSNGDSQQLTRVAHTIKGSLANFGASAAVATAQALEQAGRDGDLANCAGLLQDLQAQWRRIQDYFSRPEWPSDWPCGDGEGS